MKNNSIELKNTNSVNVGEVIDILSSSYIKLIKGNKPVFSFPSVMFWGQPGVGKSQAVRQIGKNIEQETGKKVHITDVRLLLFNPIDLRGIPVANNEKTLAVWLKPKIFQMDDSDDVINILFLDEISAAPQSVQASAYQITLDRTVGEHKLPNNCIVIAAGNRVTDKSVAYKMPKALANRLLHFDVEVDFDSWKKWALRNDINYKVIGFLSFKPNYLNGFDPSNDALTFATPRSWEMVSNILNNVDDDIDNVYLLLAGLVGNGAAIEFRTWMNIYASLPNIYDILNGKSPTAPKDPSAIFALCTSLIDLARRNKNNMRGIANIIVYADKFPKDFGVMLLEDLLLIDENMEQKIFAIPEFQRWLRENASMLNGKMNGTFK